MLPIPFKKYIPKLFSNDPKSDVLASKIDSHLGLWKQDILDIKKMGRADQCPAILLNDLGFILDAGIENSDSEAVKRKRINDAIATQKVRGSWKFNAKIIIDTITGLDSAIVHSADTDEWAIMGGNEPSPNPAEYYWATMGVNDTNSFLGMWLFGSDSEIALSGNIIINAHLGVNTPVLTAEQVAKIVTELSSDVLPAYFRITIGYYDTFNAFQVYTIIG